ncbi:MAG: sensor histidine kinase, partial [Solirubrobacteraceae bacterium]|nr:sensor histidine kinase [Patulibacter sp.]
LLRIDEAELLVAQVQRSREEQLRAAALDERSRIAREIHDVLAHSLAGLTIDLEATRMLIEQGADDTKVLARVDRAHALAREGLRETRRAIEALRGDAASVGQQLDALVTEFRNGTGTTADLQTTGDLVDLPADVGLAVVRVTQEALTNARKHAPGAAVTVTVHRTADAVDLRIESARPAARPGGDDLPRPTGGSDLASTGGGYGLRGMRERAEILGGRLDAGPSDTGWTVDLRLPLALGTAHA